jgi:hypothetical protein
MTTGIDIPVKMTGDVYALAALHRIEAALAGTGNSAATAAPKVEQLGSRFEGLGNAARHINEIRTALTSFGTSLIAAADHIAELTSEQQNLNANSAALGLNFQRSADRAGGFVTSLQAMTLATSLADRGIRATQIELDALTRIGMSRASATGKSLSEVFDSLADNVIAGGEELTKYGGNLRSVADQSHTAGDRLRALVDHAKNVAPAMRTATDEMNRFREAIRSSQRTLANAFAEEFGRLMTLPSTMREAAEGADDLNTKMRALGATGAYVLNLVGSGITAALGFMVTGVASVIGSVRVLASGLWALRNGPAAASRAMAATGAAVFGPDSFAGTVGAGAGAAAERFAALLRDQGTSRTTAAPDSDPTLASIRQERARDRAERNRRQTSGGGGGGTESDAQLARIEAGISIVSRMSPSERASRYGTEYDEVDGIIVRTSDILSRLRRERIALLTRQAEERRRGEGSQERRRRIAGLRSRIDELTREAETADSAEATAGVRAFIQQQAPARAQGEEVGRALRARAEEMLGKDRETQQEQSERSYEQSPEGMAATAAGERAKARETRDLAERRDQLQSFTDFMEQQYTRQVNLAREGAEGVATALRAMGSAFSDNLVAWADGTKTFEEAANDMLATTLSTIAKEAAQKSAFNVAEGLFALATYRYDAAALHFAAAAGYGLIAGAAGIASSEVRSAAPEGKREREQRESRESSRSAAPMSANSTTGGGALVINVAFNGPQFGTGGVVQAARELTSVINRGALQGGVQLNRLAVGAGVNG